MPVTWDHVYLLGYYGADGSSNLTSWNGHSPMIDVVVTGVGDNVFPVWHGDVPEGAKIVCLPDDVDDASAYARELNGIHAFGWHLSSKIKRGTKT